MRARLRRLDKELDRERKEREQVLQLAQDALVRMQVRVREVDQELNRELNWESEQKLRRQQVVQQRQRQKLQLIQEELMQASVDWQRTQQQEREQLLEQERKQERERERVWERERTLQLERETQLEQELERRHNLDRRLQHLRDTLERRKSKCRDVIQSRSEGDLEREQEWLEKLDLERERMLQQQLEQVENRVARLKSTLRHPIIVLVGVAEYERVSTVVSFFSHLPLDSSLNDFLQMSTEHGRSIAVFYKSGDHSEVPYLIIAYEGKKVIEYQLSRLRELNMPSSVCRLILAQYGCIWNILNRIFFWDLIMIRLSCT